MKKLIFVILIFFCLLMYSDNIEYFDIENSDSSLTKKEALQENHFYQIAVFPNGCFPCTKNRFIWNKISRLTNVKTYGIVLKSRFLTLYDKTGYVSFRLYCPVNIEHFTESLHIDGKSMYTFILKGSKIIYRSKGLFETGNYLKIKKMVVNKK